MIFRSALKNTSVSGAIFPLRQNSTCLAHSQGSSTAWDYGEWWSHSALSWEHTPDSLFWVVFILLDFVGSSFFNRFTVLVQGIKPTLPLVLGRGGGREMTLDPGSPISLNSRTFFVIVRRGEASGGDERDANRGTIAGVCKKNTALSF